MIKLITSSILLLFITGLEADICALPALSGPCDDAITRYFYNYATEQCEQFTYGGCGGNANNFESLRQCRARCKSGNGCCEPTERPGNYINPPCFEAHACCADGTWSCSIGDDKTFPCGGVNVNIVDNPEAFGEECIYCCDPAKGPPLCEGCACCQDGTWSKPNADGVSYNCAGTDAFGCFEEGTPGVPSAHFYCGGTVCDELSDGATGFIIQIETSWIITIIGILGIILLCNIIFIGYMYCNKSPKRKGKGYHVVKHADSEDVQDSEVNPINVH